MNKNAQPKPTQVSDIIGVPFRFTSLVGGVLVATMAERNGKRHTVAICVRVDDVNAAWEHYCNDVDFVLIDSNETACRYKCKGKYVVASCRVIRDCDDLPEAVAVASKDLWSKPQPHIFN
jgi:hypothetical protein